MVSGSHFIILTEIQHNLKQKITMVTFPGHTNSLPFIILAHVEEERMCTRRALHHYAQRARSLCSLLWLHAPHFPGGTWLKMKSC